MGTVTISGVTYEIYDDHTNAKEYLAASLSAEEWNEADDTKQKRALVQSTRFWDRLNWKGDLTDPTTPQPIAWPRDGTGVTGHVDGSTPNEILYGFWEIAALIIADPALTNNPTVGSNVSRVKGGEAEVWFFRSTLDDSSKLPTDALDWVKRYLTGDEGILTADSGTTDDFESLFDTCNVPTRTGGLY